MITKPDVKDTKAAFDELSEIVELIRGAIKRSAQRTPGISVIIPSYMSAKTILRTLDSLDAQTLDKNLFEVIVIFNGEANGSAEQVSAWSSQNDTNVKYVWSATKGASRARNIGLKYATREYLAFVDADDWVQPDFLSDAFSLCTPRSVVVSPIWDFDGESLSGSSSLNSRIRSLAGQAVPIASAPWALGFNACKTFHHSLATKPYDEALNSGEDLVFFANLLSHPDLRLNFLPETGENSYIRQLTEKSVSRGNSSFDFNVTQRIKCIDALNGIAPHPSNLKALEALKNAQAGFVARYISEHPGAENDLVGVLDKAGVADFPWSVINHGRARDLVIAYCFPPFNDTSSVVCAKIVADRRKKVDVISANLRGLREEDPSLNMLYSRWVDEHHILNTPPAFSNWESICAFALQSVQKASETQRKKGLQYDTLYTRAMWAGSHVAGALLKIHQPTTSWTAEFSDPLRFGVEGTPRPGEYNDDEVSQALMAVIASIAPQTLPIHTLFDLIEFSTVLLADQLIFTNGNQLDYMVSSYPGWLEEIARSKAVVRPHPSPPSRAYALVPSSYRFEEDCINLAYFGSFYANRGLHDIFVACMNLDAKVRDRVRLNLFTSTQEEVRREVASMGLEDIVRVNGYLPYLEFLNACTGADVLIVNDVKRSAAQTVNPFLPSKLSDYRNSGAKIWGIVDSDSPLSQQTLDYVSSVGDSLGALKVLTAMANSEA